ncbi:putative ribonuclease H-like domain-containing protein, partial [Tanacetum coccineum]
MINEKKKFYAGQKAKVKRSKPMTQAQQRVYMSTFIKNQSSWKLSQLKKLSFEELKTEFEKLMKSIESFVPMETEARTTQDEFNNEGEAFVKDKIKDASSESKIGVDAIPTATKPPTIVNWKIISQSNSLNPLSKDACQVMLKMKLLDGTMNEVCYQLLKMIEKEDEMLLKIKSQILTKLDSTKSSLGSTKLNQQYKVVKAHQFPNIMLFVCKSFDHVQADCNYHQRERVVSGNNYTRVNYNYSAKKAHPSAHRNMAPRAVLMKTGLRPLNTARPVNTAHPKTTVYSARPMSHFSKSAQSTIKRPYQIRTALTNKNFSQKVNTAKGKFYTARPKAVNTARPNSAVVNAVRANQGHPQKEDQGYVDSGCSRHMTGNMSYLLDFKEFDGGYVTFGGGVKGGTITSKGILKIADESQVLLKVPRKNNIYSVDIKNIVPKESLTCLVAKATLDASMIWHRRLDLLGFYFLATNGNELSGILKIFITEVENLVDKKVKIIRFANETEFKNRVISEFCEKKGIKKEFSIARTPQQNGVAEKRNRTLIEAAKPCTEESISAGHSSKETGPSQDYILIPLWKDGSLFDSSSMNASNDEPQPSSICLERRMMKVNVKERFHSDNATLEATHADFLGDEIEVDMSNITTTYPVLSTPNTRIHKDHSLDHVIGDAQSNVQTGRMTKTTNEQVFISVVYKGKTHEDLHTCLFACFLSQVEPKKRNKKDKRGIVVRNKARLVAQGYTQEEGIDYDEVFAPVARIEAMRLFLAYASFMNFVVYAQMYIKRVQILYGKIEEEVYVCQPPAFEDPEFPDRVYKVEKALYGLHQAPRAWSHLNFHIYHAVKRNLRYLKGQPKLGLWYPKDSPFDLEAYSDSDYAGAIANSTTEAEYVATTNCCKLVLWIQNQMLDYGYNFMNTKIFINNESTICIVKNPVFHSKTKHINIRHHFIRDSYKKRLIQVIKIHTDHNVADLLTKALDIDDWNGLDILLRMELRLKLAKVSAARLLTTARLPLELQLLKFWSTAKIKTVNNETQIHAKVEGKTIVISKSSMRRDLQFDDEDEVNVVYDTPSHTKKVFANMRRKEKEFSGKVTPLFDIVLIQQQEKVGEGS